MRSHAFACLLGVLLLLNCQMLLNCWHVLWVLGLLSLLRCVLGKWIPSLLLAFVFGLFWAALFAKGIESQQIPNGLQKKLLFVDGVVTSFIKEDAHSQRFVFQIDHTKGHPFLGKVRLYHYGKPLSIQPGQHWQLSVKLKKPWGFANRGGFFYQQYLLLKGFSATGYVVNTRQNHVLANANPSMLRVRSRLSNFIAQTGGGYQRFIQALTVGNRTAFTEQDWRVLRRTGTNHLVAISGLHVGLMAGLCFFLISFFWRCSARVCLLCPAQIAGAYAGILMAFVYSVLAGFALPTQRAFIMVSVFMLSMICKRVLLPWHAWCVALWIVLLLNPLSVLDSGFWLSFSAVAALIVVSDRHAKHRLVRYLTPQIVVLLGVLPFTLFYFHQFSLIAPLANLITIPIVGFIVVPICLLMCLCWLLHGYGAAVFLEHLAAHLIAVVWRLLTELSQWPDAVVSVNALSVWQLGILLLFVLLFLIKWPWKYKWVIFLSLPLCFMRFHAVPHGDFKLTLLDVGQGLSAVVQTQHHSLLFDAGPKFSKDFDTGEAVVLPFLQSQGIKQLSKMVISHGDNDHIGGAYSVIKSMPVHMIQTSVPKRFKQASYCLAGQHWEWDGVHFRFLYPDKSHLGLDNNSSCVLKISDGRGGVLLTGDIEAYAERILLKKAKRYLPSTILIAPHHGSKTSSTLAFVKAVHPDYVFYPTGYLNRFHFPNKIIVQRYRTLHVKSLNTANCGAISVNFNGKAIKPMCYRKTLPFYMRQR